MSIPLADAPMPPVVIIVGICWMGLAMMAIFRLGVLRRASIIGPPRLEPNESAWSLVFILFFAVSVAFLVIGPVVGKMHPPEDVRPINITLLLAFIGSSNIMAANALFRRHGLTLLGLRLRQFPLGIALAATTWFIVIPLIYLTSEGTIGVLHLLNRPEPQPHQLLEFIEQTDDRRLIALAVVLAVLIVPFFEELVFRGMLQTIIVRCFAKFQRQRRGFEVIMPGVPIADEAPPIAAQLDLAWPRWLGVYLTAALFAAAHGELAFAPPLFVLAVGLGYLYERTRNLWACMITHGLFNLFQVAVFWQMFLRH